MKTNWEMRLPGIIAILVMLLSNLFQVVPVSALGRDQNSGKISSLLYLHVKIKEQSNALANQRSAGLLGVDSTATTETIPVNSERVYLHFAQEPTPAQINDLKSLGVIVYPNSWLPPVDSFKTGFVLAEMPVNRLEALAAMDYIVSLDTAEQQLANQNDQARAAMNVDPVWSSGDTGAGVTVAVIDSGLDTANPDFPTPLTAIDYSAYPATDSTITNTVTGHGTHVTGSLLGRGVNSPLYKGIAPGASLVFIKVGDDVNAAITSSAMTYAIRDAASLYHAKIINVSIGAWSQYHDGSDQWCQAVDYATSLGSSVFVAAGNYAASSWHYSGAVNARSVTPDIPISISQGNTSYLNLNLVWYDGLGLHNNLTLQYFDANHNLLSPVSGGQSESVRGTEADQYYFNTLQNSGTFYLRVTNNSSAEQAFHIYYGGGSSAVTFASADAAYTIASPAEADSSIAVGAYTTRTSWTNYQGHPVSYTQPESIGSIASYSSRGPRIDPGAPPKPDVVAPGGAIISVRDPFYTPGNPNYNPGIIDNDGLNLNGSGPANYFVMQGTSMATPMAAGVGALILSKDPTLSPAQVKQALESTATDKGTPGWDDISGYGLINAVLAVNYSLPIVTTGLSIRSSNIIGATLNGTLVSTGPFNAVAVSFEYGLNTNYGTIASGNPATLYSPGTFSAVITGLTPNQTYHFRAIGDGGSGKISKGLDRTFSTTMVSGKFAFVGRTFFDDVFIMNGDGTNITRLTDSLSINSHGAENPVISPDGTKIAYIVIDVPTGGGTYNDSIRDIWVMNIDGSNKVKITPNSANYGSIAWSPNGDRIACGANGEIYVMNSNGANMFNLTNNPGDDSYPTWSPDGTKIAFISSRNVGNSSEIYIMNSDGTNVRRLTDDTHFEGFPAWSPDGTKIAFTMDSDSRMTSSIYSMNTDGTGQTRLTDGCLATWVGNQIACIILMPISRNSSTPAIAVFNEDGSNQYVLSTRPLDIYSLSWGPSSFGLPSVLTDPAADAGITSATLNGYLTNKGGADDVSVSFDWGLDATYSGGNIVGVPLSLSAPGAFTGNLTGLTPSQIYHYRAKAVGSGVSYGNDITFTTAVAKLAFITGPQVIGCGSTSGSITIQNQTSSGTPLLAGTNIEISLTSSSPNGRFDTSAAGPFDGSITRVTIPAGSNQVSFYYRDTRAGAPSLTVTGPGPVSVSQSATVNPGLATQIRVETAADGSGSVMPLKHLDAGQSVTVYSVTRDQYGNYLTNLNGTWSLTNQTGSVANTDLVPALNGKSAVFTAHLIGRATIRVASGSFASVESGMVTVMAGDANGDGVINMADVTKVERIVLSLDPPIAGADANLDGTVNMADVTMIERIVLGLN